MDYVPKGKIKNYKNSQQVITVYIHCAIMLLARTCYDVMRMPPYLCGSFPQNPK